MTSGAIALLLYGLAYEGWMMYCIIFANLLGAAAGPAMQSIVSKAVGPKEQGLTQGSLTAINSVAIIFAPLLGTAILARVGHLPAQDWRMGSTFLLCAVLQVIALALAVAHFRRMAARPT